MRSHPGMQSILSDTPGHVIVITDWDVGERSRLIGVRGVKNWDIHFTEMAADSTLRGAVRQDVHHFLY